MEYPASKTRSLNIAFVVNTDLLKRLAKILGETSNNLEYNVKFSDGTSVRYGDIIEVIGQPNSNRRSIVALIAGTGTAEKTDKSAYVNLRKTVPSLEYTINGTQRNVIYLADKLDDWSATIRQWYSPIFSRTASMLSVLLVALPVLVAYRVSLFYPPIVPAKGIVLIVVALLATAALEVCALWFFPLGTFAIGDGERRHQLFTYVRRGVLLTFGLSVIAGVVANLITSHH